jgi:hypothetical protein
LKGDEEEGRRGEAGAMVKMSAERTKSGGVRVPCELTIGASRGFTTAATGAMTVAGAVVLVNRRMAKRSLREVVGAFGSTRHICSMRSYSSPGGHLEVVGDGGGGAIVVGAAYAILEVISLDKVEVVGAVAIGAMTAPISCR